MATVYDTFEDPEVQTAKEADVTGKTATETDGSSLKGSDSLEGSLIFSGIYTTEDRERVEREYSGRIIFPWYKSYKTWWGLTVVASIFTFFFVTYQIAFAESVYPYQNSASILEYTTLALFILDIGVNFNLAYYGKSDQVVCDRRMIAKRYCKKMFWIDLVGVLPFYPVALAAADELQSNSNLAHYLSFLRLLRLVRLHRLRHILDFLRNTTSISLVSLTMVRNFAVTMVWTHFSACVIYFIARQHSFGVGTTWIGGQEEDLSSLERYSTSLYWSVVTFTTVGYGDFSPVNSAEQIWGIIYMLCNIVVQSWIIGSVTLLVVKADEQTGLYRSTLKTLETYSSMHKFDENFEKHLRRQLKLDFNNREISDEQVLKNFPTSVRSRVLKKLYLPALSKTSLLKGIREQFVEAFLTTCKVEIFSPGEEVLQRGSIASDLYLLVGGSVNLLVPDTSLNEDDSGSDGDESFVGKHLSAGHFINEIGFFTESPQIETVRTIGVVKTLTMSRTSYKFIAQDHPGSVGKILENLLRKVEAEARETGSPPKANLPRQLSLLRAGSVFDIPEKDRKAVKDSDYANTTLTRTRDLINMHISKQKDDHTTRFLFAASRGDTATITLMCDQGFDPNSADYDSRTALMVAAMKGNTEVVEQLLEYGADPNLVDMHGSTALYETVKNGHEATMDALLKHNADLCMEESLAASTLCQAVFDGDILTLRRLLRANIQVNAADYDKRTAAHIAGAEGNVAALRLLREFQADLNAKDRWGNTTEDEAKRANASDLLQFLSKDED